MGFLRIELFKKKQTPGEQLMRDLEATGAPQLLAKKEEELKGGVRKHSDSMSAWLELNWPKRDPASKANKLRVETDKFNTKVLISREGSETLVALGTVYDASKKPYADLTLADKINVGANLAQATPPSSASISNSSKV